jgi:hypothetical protein
MMQGIDPAFLLPNAIAIIAAAMTLVSART